MCLDGKSSVDNGKRELTDMNTAASGNDGSGRIPDIDASNRNRNDDGENTVNQDANESTNNSPAMEDFLVEFADFMNQFSMGDAIDSLEFHSSERMSIFFLENRHGTKAVIRLACCL